MVQIILTNMKIDEELNNKIIYKPTVIKKNLEYKIIFKSEKPIQIQFILYANFINSIGFEFEFESDNNTLEPDKLETVPHQGLSVGFKIDKNNGEFVININPIDLCTKITLKNLTTYPIDNLIQIKWDNIFIINLPRRSDRKEEMIKKLSQANITKYNFVEGFDGSDPELANKFTQLKAKYNNPIVTSGHFACLLSHIKAIKLAKLSKYSNIMILEDDVFFLDNFLNKLNNLRVPQFDMLYLGGIISKKKLFFNDWIFAKDNKIMGAYGYILDNLMFDIILDKLEKLSDYVDLSYIQDIQPNHTVILLNDYIKTNLTSTDTSHKSKKLTKRLEYIK